MICSIITHTQIEAHMPKNWIKGAISKPGALHKELGVKKGKKIPEKKLEKALHSKNPLERKRAELAKTLGKLRK